jgi:hypothetical protein
MKIADARLWCYPRGMAARHERICWDEATLRRLAAGRADGIFAAELAVRFGVTCATIHRKLATLGRTAPNL